MNAGKALAAESTVALAGVIAGDLLPKQDRTLPSPRRILAVYLFYGALSLIAGFGEGPARFAAAAGGVTALAALVIGAVGQGILGLLRSGTGLFAQPAPTAPAQPSRAYA